MPGAWLTGNGTGVFNGDSRDPIWEGEQPLRHVLLHLQHSAQ